MITMGCARMGNWQGSVLKETSDDSNICVCCFRMLRASCQLLQLPESASLLASCMESLSSFHPSEGFYKYLFLWPIS